MRKFKLLTQDGYSYNLIKGKVYNENYLPVGNTVVNVKAIAEAFPHDWQEVTEEEIKLTEVEKIMLIGFLNENFEEFCDFINDPENISPDYYFSLGGGYRGKPSNLIDKIEKL